MNFYTFTSINMEKEKLTLVNVCELSPEEMEELYLEEWDEMSLFEWDPDYMVTPDGEYVYFFIWSDKNLVVTSNWNFDFDEELLEFCRWQDTKVSLWGYNTRSESKHWKYFEDNTRDAFEENKNLKIAYRWGCGYVYTLFEYVD